MDKRQRKLLFIALVFFVGISIFIAAVDMVAVEMDKVKKFEIGSGSVGGIYFIAGSAFADLFQKKLGMNIPFTASVTEGSGENVRLLDSDRIEAGTIASNALYPSWYGQKPYEKQYRHGRMVMWVFPNPTVFFALADKKIIKIRDLKGKRVGVGAGPSTWDHLTGPFLEAHGIDYKNDIKRVYGSFEDLCNQVRDGLLDASIGNISAGVNLMPAISALAAEKKLAFLEWDPQAIESIPTKIPYFKKAIVSAAALPGRQTDYVTLDLGAMLLVVRYDLPEAFIYKMTKIIHENLPELAKTAKLFKYAVDSPKFMTQRLGDVEFHQGSVRYWKEAGLW